jgi:hypothetical protein
MMALTAIGISQLLDNYKHNGVSRDTVITAITIIGILALFMWLIFEAQ